LNGSLQRGVWRVRIGRPRLVVAAVAASGALALMAASANANVGPFCPPDGGTIGLYAYRTPNNRDRCAHGYHNGVVWVGYANYSTPVEKCAVLKPNSDGSGANVGGLQAACATSVLPANQYPPSLSGYATGINKGANYHTGFSGDLQYI
jgi:hypothetical protein